jgi:integrase
MSSLCNRPNGHQWIFYKFNSKRHTLRLGPVSREIAVGVQQKLDRLIQCRQVGAQLDGELIAWLCAMGDQLHCNLVQSGLAEPRGPSSLGDLLNAHESSLVARGAKGSTRLNNRILHGNLRKFFGEKKRLDAIKLQDAENFFQFLSATGGREGGPLAVATVSNRIKRAKAAFAYAIKNGWLSQNPFDHVRTGSEVNTARDHYILPEIFEKILDLTADKELRWLLALVRYCGLRCPSEIQVLNWTNLDWAGGVLVVHSPKTGRREVPVFAAAVPFLHEAWEAAPEKQAIMFPRHQASGQAIVGRLDVLCRKAGEVLWPKPMVNMRASAERDLIAAKHDIQQVASWLGHSPVIALKHYSRIIKEREARQAQGVIRPELQVSDAKRDAMFRIVPLRTATGGYGSETSNPEP